jgi:hypothetical protein
MKEKKNNAGLTAFIAVMIIVLATAIYYGYESNSGPDYETVIVRVSYNNMSSIPKGHTIWLYRQGDWGLESLGRRSESVRNLDPLGTSKTDDYGDAVFDVSVRYKELFKGERIYVGVSPSEELGLVESWENFIVPPRIHGTKTLNLRMFVTETQLDQELLRETNEIIEGYKLERPSREQLEGFLVNDGTNYMLEFAEIIDESTYVFSPLHAKTIYNNARAAKYNVSIVIVNYEYENMRGEMVGRGIAFNGCILDDGTHVYITAYRDSIYEDMETVCAPDYVEAGREVRIKNAVEIW